MSQGGAEYPFWSPDGNAVYYWNSSGAETFQVAYLELEPTPVVLFREPLFTGNYSASRSDLHPDGDRLVNAPLATEGAGGVERFFVVTNWFEEVRERLGGN